MHREVCTERSLLPLLQIAYEAVPGAAAPGQEHLFVFGRVGGFEEEYLDEGAWGGAAKLGSFTH